MKYTNISARYFAIALAIIVLAGSGCAIWLHGYTYEGETYLTPEGALDAQQQYSIEVVQSVTPRATPNGQSLLCINNSAEKIRATCFDESFLIPGYDMRYLATSRYLLFQTLYESIIQSNIFTKTDIITTDEILSRYDPSYDYILYFTCEENPDFLLKSRNNEPEPIKMEDKADTLINFVDMFLHSLEEMVNADNHQIQGFNKQ